MAGDVGSSHFRTDFGELSDAELVRATRDGSRRAYAALYARHSLSALKYAKTLTSSDADDVVSEAFLKVYSAIKSGRGPEEDFRYYVRSAVRNTYVSMVRARRTDPAGDAIEDVVGDRGADIASLRSFDGSATARAFLSLPTRWQEVLWYTEVEGYTREHTATLLGMNANAVSALSFRAREALRTAWLQEHISAQSDLDRGCEAITPLLGAYSRRGLSRRDRLRVEHHVTHCAHCTSIVEELAELLTPGRLALVLLPVVLAGGGFAAFASKAGAGTGAVAVGVAPSTAVLASVGGSGAAGGAAALSVLGKVAACALVAGLVVPPTQMLIAASQHAPTAHHSPATHSDAPAGQFVLADAAHAGIVAFDAPVSQGDDSIETPAVPDAGAAEAEDAQGGRPEGVGNLDPGANAKANEAADDGNANGGRKPVEGASPADASVKAGKSAKSDDATKANEKATGTASPTPRPTPSPNANASSTGGADGGADANVSSNPKRGATAPMSGTASQTPTPAMAADDTAPSGAAADDTAGAAAEASSPALAEAPAAGGTPVSEMATTESAISPGE
jgi:RNA polymerase sigma factor (sigma-70 family)